LLTINECVSDEMDFMFQMNSGWRLRLQFVWACSFAIGIITHQPAAAGDRRWERQGRRQSLIVPHCLPTACPVDPQHCGTALSPGMTGEVGVRPSSISPKPLIPAITSKPKVTKPELVHLGYSVKGIPIVMHVFGVEGPMTLIFGAIHGSEPNSGDLARHVQDYLLEHPEAYQSRRVAVIPVTNPDGLVRNQRLNEHKIDLNRNFPAANWGKSKPGMNFGGDKAASEPETVAIIKAVDLLSPKRIVSIHAITRGRECNNFDGPGADLAEAMKAKNGYRVAKTIGYPTPGSFGSWAGTDRQIATITLELPVDLPGEECWKVHMDALLTVIQNP